MKEFYTIDDVATITGLTTRTLRNYIASGILAGEKADGAWRFSPEQLDALISNPEANRSMRAHRNSVVYDFMRDHFKPQPQACLILDLPDANPAQVSAFFCSRTPADTVESGYQFCFEQLPRLCRVILKGPAALVQRIAGEYLGE